MPHQLHNGRTAVESMIIIAVERHPEVVREALRQHDEHSAYNPKGEEEIREQLKTAQAP